MNYGNGLTVDWTQDELAKIKLYRANAIARRVVGTDNPGHLKAEEGRARLRRIAQEIYTQVINKESN